MYSGNFETVSDDFGFYVLLNDSLAIDAEDGREGPLYTSNVLKEAHQVELLELPNKKYLNRVYRRYGFDALVYCASHDCGEGVHTAEWRMGPLPPFKHLWALVAQENPALQFLHAYGPIFAEKLDFCWVDSFKFIVVTNKSSLVSSPLATWRANKNLCENASMARNREDAPVVLEAMFDTVDNIALPIYHLHLAFQSMITFPGYIWIAPLVQLLNTAAFLAAYTHEKRE